MCVCVRARSKSPTEIIRPGFAGNDGSRIDFLQKSAGMRLWEKEKVCEKYSTVLELCFPVTGEVRLRPRGIPRASIDVSLVAFSR